MKPTTIPRLELTAATVAVKQDIQIREELHLEIESVLFWTDSTCVLQYINNPLQNVRREQGRHHQRKFEFFAVAICEL